jgi:DNA-binding GntR family transcriptional regulator
LQSALIRSKIFQPSKWVFQGVKLIKIHDTSISKQVVRELRQQIFSGQLKSGEKVPENKIAEEMGISRGPVREALLVLEQEGLVETNPRKGSRVAKITLKDIREMYTLRALLEGFAVTLFMGCVTDERLAELEGALADLAQAVANKDVIEISRMNLRFHEIILIHSNHGRVLSAWKSLQAQSRMLSSMTTEYYLGLEDLYQHHVSLAEVIRSGNKRKARKCFEKHILDSMEQLIISLKEKSSLEEGGK